MGLEKTQHIGRIVVHPRNPNIVYVAALGAAWKTNPERGLYKTKDGGQTWKLAKFISDKAGFIDVELDPANPDVVWAASWERIRGPYFLKSGGPGSALWKSTDAGATWTEVKGGGWPETQKGRINLSIFPGDGKIVYAMVEADSAAEHDARVSRRSSSRTGCIARRTAARTGRRCTTRTRGRSTTRRCSVHPQNPNRVWFSSTPMLVSNDGGRTSREALRDVHVDTHAMWIDPDDPEHMVVGNDGGVAITWDGGGNWDFGEYFPIGQFYEVSYDFACRTTSAAARRTTDRGAARAGGRGTCRTATGSWSRAATASTRSRTRPNRTSSGRNRRAATSSARTSAPASAPALAKPNYRAALPAAAKTRS